MNVTKHKGKKTNAIPSTLLLQYLFLKSSSVFSKREFLIGSIEGFKLLVFLMHPEKLGIQFVSM